MPNIIDGRAELAIGTARQKISPVGLLAKPHPLNIKTIKVMAVLYSALI